jgi:hypothetical protein
MLQLHVHEMMPPVLLGHAYILENRGGSALLDVLPRRLCC